LHAGDDGIGTEGSPAYLHELRFSVPVWALGGTGRESLGAGDGDDRLYGGVG